MRALMNILLNIWRGLLLHHPHGVSQAVVVRLWQHLVQKIGIGSSCWGRGQRFFWFWGVFAWWTLSNESMRGVNNRVLIIYVLLSTSIFCFNIQVYCIQSGLHRIQLQPTFICHQRLHKRSLDNQVGIGSNYVASSVILSISESICFAKLSVYLPGTCLHQPIVPFELEAAKNQLP